MNIVEVKGYVIEVTMHGDQKYYRETNINTPMEPKEIEALFEYVGAVGALGNFVKAIKFARQELDCGLRAAKDFAEDARVTFRLKNSAHDLAS